jgi:signal transduction histidine kinase
MYDQNGSRANATKAARIREAEDELVRLKSAFIANTTHEIRTPLNAIVGYSELIAEHLNGLDDPTVAHYVNGITRASERLARTIAEILDYAQAESGTFALNPSIILLAPVLGAAVENMRGPAHDKNIELRLNIEDAAARVVFDLHCLESALSHLMRNAVKFTRRGMVSVSLFRAEGNALLVEVRDSGIGIGPSFMPHLFEPFSQEQSTRAREFDGLGLGLALSKKLLEMNGAAIAVQSEKGKGSTFTVRMPMAAEELAGSLPGRTKLI